MRVQMDSLLLRMGICLCGRTFLCLCVDVPCLFVVLMWVGVIVDFTSTRHNLFLDLHKKQ